MLGNFFMFLSSADILQHYFFSKYSFRNNIKVSNSLDPDQDGCSAGPNLDPNCLKRLAADDKMCC